MFALVEPDLDPEPEDVSKIIPENDYSRKVSSKLIFKVEEEEKIFFLLASSNDEYCFTNIALIHIHGPSDGYRRRLVNRLRYSDLVSKVSMEIEAVHKRNFQMKFSIGNTECSIRVTKYEAKELFALYKVLLKIEEIQKENGILHNYGAQSLAIAEKVAAPHGKVPANSNNPFALINSYAFRWLEEINKKYRRKDFGEVFKKYGRE